MSFEIRPDKRVDNELRRLARKELREARARLGSGHPPQSEAVHEARKSLKKVRAIVRLLDADNGKGLDRTERQLKKAAHTLSRVRDADAMIETVGKLRRKKPRLFDPHTTHQLRAWIAKHRRNVRADAARDEVWTSIDRRLRSMRRKAKHWRPSHRAFGAVSRGIAGSLRRGRKALRRATKRRRADDFHRWRKELKSLWYDLRLLESAAPRIARDVRTLHKAETLLGDDHNVVILCTALSDDGTFASGPLVRRIKAAADEYHSDARRKAVAAARHIYTRKPRRYMRDLKRAWKNWRHGVTARS